MLLTKPGRLKAFSAVLETAHHLQYRALVISLDLNVCVELDYSYELILILASTQPHS